MKPANLSEIEAVAQIALADVQPQFMTPQLCLWALTKAQEGYSALEIRQTALEAQNLAIQKQLEALTANAHSQNDLLVKVVETQQILAQKVEKLETTPKVEYRTETYHNHVEVGDNCKGVVVNLENSPHSSKTGMNWLFMLMAAALLVLCASGRVPALNYADGYINGSLDGKRHESK